MRALRGLLIVVALALVAGSFFSDRIIGAVVIVPALLISVIISIACLSADLVRPRRRVAVSCSALSIVAPFPFLAAGYPLGHRLAAVALIVLQVIPLWRTWRPPSPTRPPPGAGVLAALVDRRPRSCSSWSPCSSGSAPAYLSKSSVRRLLAAARTSCLSPPPSASLAWKLASGRGDGDPARSRPRTARRVTARDGRPLSRLAPGTRYLLDAPTSRAGASCRGRLHRPRRPPRPRPITLVSVRRLRLRQRARVRGRPARRGRDPALVLSAGDNAYLLAAPPLLDRAIFDPLHALLAEAPMVATLGEHDLAWNDGSAVISALHLPGHHYSVQYGPVQIVVLGLQADSSTPAYANATARASVRPRCPIRFVLIHRVDRRRRPDPAGAARAAM